MLITSNTFLHQNGQQVVVPLRPNISYYLDITLNCVQNYNSMMKENVRQFIGMQIDEVLIYSSNEQIHDYHFYDYNCSYHDSMTRAIKSSVSLKFKLNMP